jgi:hypothetical protein
MRAAGDLPLDRPGTLYLPFFFSLLLHALFVFLTAIGPSGALNAPSSPLDVELLRPEEAQKRDDARRRQEMQSAAPEEAISPPKSQIVSPPESPEAKPPEDTRLLSDRDSHAPQETVKRGEPAPPAEPPRTKAKVAPAERSAAKPPEGEPGEEKPAGSRKPPPPPASDLPGLAGLLPRPSDLIRDPALGDGSGTRDKTTEKGSGRDYAAVARPELWADPGERGTPDYLPDVRLGSFTLLNTKADLFAPFVRRVGLRVFQSFSMDFKRQIFAGSVPQGREKIEIEAVMSRDGRRLEVRLRNRSGNLATDRVLLATLNDQIFFDENPPPKAVAADGLIHFVFALDASVWYGREDAGAPVQPGAHWIFGAGLL